MDYIAWTEKWTTGQRWFDRLRSKKGSPRGTLNNYGTALHRFAEFKQKDPDEIFAEYKAYAKEDLDEALDKIEIDLDLFINWLVKRRLDKIEGFNELPEDKQQKHRDKARASAAQKHTAIRSWLKNNAKSFKGIPSPETYSEEIPPITIEELREVLTVMDARETFITLFLKDTGISQAEALKINYGHIRKSFERGDQFVYIKVFRQKEHVNYETFFGPNTVKALKTWLKIRKRQGERITDKTPLMVQHRKLFTRLTKTGIMQIYDRISKQTGIKISTHRLRKFFETYMAIGVRHPIILKYWMGHKIKGGKSDVDARYIILPKSEQLKLYMKSYKYIDVTPQRDEFELFIAETKARAQNLTPEQKRRMIKELATRRPGLMEHPEIKRILEESTKAGSLPAELDYKEIKESQLLAYLQNGYSIVHNLQNGRVIVKR